MNMRRNIHYQVKTKMRAIIKKHYIMHLETQTSFPSIWSIQESVTLSSSLSAEVELSDTNISELIRRRCCCLKLLSSAATTFPNPSADDAGIPVSATVKNLHMNGEHKNDHAS